jgi:hypothetical protein
LSIALVVWDKTRRHIGRQAERFRPKPARDQGRNRAAVKNLQQTMPQGGSCFATLGLETESRWNSETPAPGKDLRAAQASAYAAVKCIQFDGAHFRHDIAAEAF